MFILHFLPDWLLAWFINTVLIVGAVLTAASYLTKWFPFIQQYRTLAQTVGIILLVCGVYFKGGEASELQWRDRVAEQQKKIEIAQEKSKEANRQLEDELKKSKLLTEKVKDATRTSIQANATQIDAECRVPDIAISLHNSSSLNEIPRSARGVEKALPNAGTSQSTGSSVK